MIKFKLAAISGAFFGTVPIEIPEGTVITLPTVPDNNIDALAETLAIAGQKILGDNLAALAHQETVERTIENVRYSVRLAITYGAGGARQEAELERTELALVATAEPPAAPTGVVPSEPAAPVETAAGAGDSLAEKIARGEAPDRRMVNIGAPDGVERRSVIRPPVQVVEPSTARGQAAPVVEPAQSADAVSVSGEPGVTAGLDHQFERPGTFDSPGTNRRLVNIGAPDGIERRTTQPAQG